MHANGGFAANGRHLAQCAHLTALSFCRHLVGPALISALADRPVGMLAYPFGDGDLPIHGTCEGRDRTLLGKDDALLIADLACEQRASGEDDLDHE